MMELPNKSFTLSPRVSVQMEMVRRATRNVCVREKKTRLLNLEEIEM